MKLMLAAVSLSLLFLASHADQLLWVGGTMNFSTPANWLGDFAPGSNATIPCSTFFGGPSTTVISQLASQTYTLGQVLNLPANGVLRLANDGTVLSFTDFGQATCNGPSAQWVGGLQPEQRNDFACHRNYIYQESGVALERPFCTQDTLNFDSYSAYHVTIPTNMSLLLMSGLNFGSVTVASNSSSEVSKTLPQLDLRNSETVVYIGSSPLSSVCRPMGQTTLNTNNCVCYSSCPTDAMFLSDQDLARLAAQAAAARLTAALNTYYTVPFSGTMSLSSLYLTPAQANQIMGASGSAVAIQDVIASNLLGLPAVSVSGVTVVFDSNTNTFTVTGTINATLGSLNAVGSTSTTPPTSVTWTSTSVAIPSNATRVQTIAQSSTASTSLSLYATILSIQAAATTTQQSVPVQSVISQLTVVPNGTAILTAVINDPCFSTCTTTCDTCLPSLTTTLTNAGIPAANASSLATNLIAVRSANVTAWTATVNVINTTLTQTAAAAAAVQQAASASPQDVAVAAGPFYIGRSLSLATQLMSTSMTNMPNLLSAVSNSLINFQNIHNAANVSASFVGQVPNGARRRRRSIDTPSAIQVFFTMNISCLSNDMVCMSNPALSTANPLYAALMTRLNAGLNGLNLVVQCKPSMTSSSFDINCLNAVGLNACQSAAASGYNASVAQMNASNAIYSVTRCGGIYPVPYPNGTCVDSTESPNQRMLADALSVAILANSNLCGASATVPIVTTTAPPTTATGGTGGDQAASIGGGGGGGLGMAAGAAGGGVIIIIIIVVVVIRKKKNNQTSQRKVHDDRTVVAFENPMYDDSTAQGGAPQPLYDTKMMPNEGGEGLYDEPAFSAAAAKLNPVYQSTEDLSHQPTYLDTEARGGDGYLDVSANKGDDVGYLGGDVGYLG